MSELPPESPRKRIARVLTALEEVQRLNAKFGVNTPNPTKEISSALIQLYWAVECAQTEIRALRDQHRE